MMESIWKWLLRFLVTVILFLVIGLLSLAVVSVPRVWSVIDGFSEVTDSLERTSRSLKSTSEKASEAIDQWSEEWSER